MSRWSDYDYEPDAWESERDDVRAESEAEKRAERRNSGWCPTCRHYGHSLGCPDAPEPPEDDDAEDETACA